MNAKDRQLGMDRNITRRDILHGGAMLAGGLAAAQFTSACAAPADDATYTAPSGNYPPTLTGMRGNHPGSFEVAHQLGREGISSWGQVQTASDEPYDLIVVGAGISGLAAAYFYLKDNPKARVLILDNHDDFGGHAKRNEFEIDGKTVIGYGGSQTMQEPSLYSRQAKRMLKDLGVKLKAFEKAYDQGFYDRNGLRPGLFFDAAHWGERAMVPYNIGMFEDYLPFGPNALSADEAVDMMPMSGAAKAQLKRLLTLKENVFKGIDADDRWEYLYAMSYREFLADYVGITEPEVFKFFQDLTSDSGVGIEAASAFSALNYGGLPGWDATGLGKAPSFADPYIHHFPDGNASIARLLVRGMIPGVAPDGPTDKIVFAPFDYAKLDEDASPVRLRLSSTVVNVTSRDTSVSVTYVQNGTAVQVQGSKCILACNHSIIPYLCPQLPEDQREALGSPERTPILYTTVATRNWEAWKAIGIGALYAPGSYYVHAKLDFPVSMGGYEHSKDPSQPVLVHMERFPHVNNEGLTKREQCQMGRYELLSTPLEDIERETRSQLAAILGPGGFDPARDITAITVNRWAHGYSYSYSPLFDDVYDEWDDPRMPHMIARKPFGRITIANSDAGAIALLDNAIDQGYRAVQELRQI